MTTIADLRALLEQAQLPWTSAHFGTVDDYSWATIAMATVNAMPALLDEFEALKTENERLRALPP